MSNKFAAALKPAKPQQTPVMAEIAPTATAEATEVSSGDGKPSRQGTKHIGAYFDPAVSKQLRQIALQEDTSVQDLLGEAIDMLFQSRQKPMIAKKQVQV